MIDEKVTYNIFAKMAHGKSSPKLYSYIQNGIKFFR